MNEENKYNERMIEWLESIGINTELTTRVIIDIQPNSPIKAHVNYIFDDKIFDINESGLDIEIVEKSRDNQC